MDTIIKEDIENIGNSAFIPWKNLDGATILLTGATGLIGYTLVQALLYNAKEVKLYIVTRDARKAKERFKEADNSGNIFYLEDSVETLKCVESEIDFIIHGAADTSSKAFVEKPVECISTIIKGTKNLLEIAREKKVKSFVFLSSMEIYGYPQEGQKIKENDFSKIRCSELRSSYPVAKMAAEALCISYFSEYDLPTKIIRLTQTFGPGVEYFDKRVFAEFARCAIEKRDIVLKTTGNTKRSYLYTADATTAILIVLLKGNDGEVYNAANENTYCSIRQMAETTTLLANIRVKYNIQNEVLNGYAHELYMDLDTKKLKSLGWGVQKNTMELCDMMSRMISWLISFYEGCLDDV